MDARDVVADLTAESEDLDALVAPLPGSEWNRQTPAVGWTIAHQIAHLAWTDNMALMAITDPAAFMAHLQEALAKAGSSAKREERAPASTAVASSQSFADEGAEEFLAEPGALLVTWRDGRAALAQALVGLPSGVKVPWFGTAMAPASMATARIMETWAHGLDVAEALGVQRQPTARLRNIAHLGHRTLGYSFLARGRVVPSPPVRVELTAPDGTQWTFGPEDAVNRVTGPALDFCLLVTQRRHRSDLALEAEGPVADEWLDIAQAFAGPPGTGRQPTGAAA